jgi:2-oxoglutarate ferredoxin oxidoreductase subunit alpha
MNDISILIGGKAGFGIDRSGLIIAGILSRLGYHVYVYRDYPSLIRGGHTFSIIRASSGRIAAHSDKIDILLALDQNTLDQHKWRLGDGSVIVYDSDAVKSEDMGVPLGVIVKESGAPDIMRNTAIIGSFCKAAGIGWNVLEDVFSRNFPKELDLNLKVAEGGYKAAKEVRMLAPVGKKALPILTGNEALSLGLVNAGLDIYISYPMTPTSPVLHYLASQSERFNIKVLHPESEIAVIMMAMGASYCGKKAAVGSSGGGFCLMTEGLSLSGMAELPVVIILGQRPGPSTGLPTYSCQTELLFALYAGQGEFVRFITAPGDPEEAFYWSGVALNMSTKYQIPSFVLTDKTLGESNFSFDKRLVKDLKEEETLAWDRKAPYKRYAASESGVSPLAFVPDKDAVVKANSYEHDEYGITTENPGLTTTMQDKRMRKGRYLADELERYECVKVDGERGSETALLCWGSNKGVCIEAARELGFKVIQPLVMSPFPVNQFREALKGVKDLIAVENNATGQLAELIKTYGFKADKKILKYDGRPFSIDELIGKLQELK